MNRLVQKLSLGLVAVMALFAGACTADYDEFGKSDYKDLKNISFEEQDGLSDIYSGNHQILVTLVAPPESLSTWDSVTIEDFSMSSLASLYLVESKFKKFPADSAGLDSLAAEVAYSKNKLHPGDKIRIPASLTVYLVVVSESGLPSIWQVAFTIPGVEKPVEPDDSEDEENGNPTEESSSSSQNEEEVGCSSSNESFSSSSSAEEEDPSTENLPKILSLKIEGKAAIIDEEKKYIHVDSLEFRSDLSSLKLTELKLAETTSCEGFEEGSSYDFSFGKTLKVKNSEGVEIAYKINVGYQLPGSHFNTWTDNNVVPDSVWSNANTVLTTTKKYSSGSMVGAEIKTGSAFGKLASGSLYTAEFNPNDVKTLSMASSSTWPDGNELLDFGKPFKARPEFAEVLFSYKGSGDSCDIYVLLENRTGNKNVNRKSTDVNKLVASAWYRSTTDNNSGRTNPDVVSISEPNDRGMRTLRLKLKYGEPLSGSPIEKSSTFATALKSSNQLAINNGVIQGTGEEPVTHIRVVFASSADGNHYKGKDGATLVVDSFRLIY